jgi:hypothetical protein
MHRALALAVICLPALSFAQDAKKFNAKELEKEFAPVPVYAKGGVVDNEVMVSQEPKRDFVQAVYVVRAEKKKVVEFYQTKLKVTPKVEGEEELGSEKYIFALPLKKGDDRLYKVTLSATDTGGNTVVTLMHRKASDDERTEE